MAARLTVEPDESLDQIIARLKNYDSQDVVLDLPTDTHALQDLNSFTALRNTVRTENINLTIAGGNKTIRALANLLGFAVEKPANSIPRPDPTAPTGQGTIVRPDYSGVADGFVGTTSEQKFTRPETGFPSVTPPPAPVQPQIAPAQQVAPPTDNRQPRPQPGINLSSQQSNNQLNPKLSSQPTPTTEDRTRNGFFAAPAPELGKMDATFQTAPGQTAEDYEPLPGFLDELVAEDTVAGQFRARQGTPPPRPAGKLFDRKRPNQSANQFDAPEEEAGYYDIEDVPDPDAESLDVAAASGVFTQQRSRPTPVAPVRPKGRPVAGAVSGPTVAPRGGVTTFLLSGDRRTTWTLALAVLFAVMLVIVLFLLLLKPGGVMTLVQPKVQALTVPLKTEIVTNTLRLQLVPSNGMPPTQAALPSGTSSQPDASGTTAASATPGLTPTTSAAPATLPVEVINTGEIKKAGTVPATGVRKVPDQSSSGPVAFYNRSFSPKSFGAGTVIYTRNGVTYRLAQAITIPASAQFNGQAGQATGEVVADKAGSVGNVAEAVNFPINENVGVSLGPLTNGTDKDEKFVAQADLDGLKNTLQTQARAEVNNALKYDQSTQGIFVIKTTEPVCTFPQKVNDTAATVSGSCTTSLDAARYRTADVAAGAAAHFVTDPTLQLDGQTPLEFVGAPKLVSDQGNNYMEIAVRGRVIHLLDANAFKISIAGQPKAAALTVVTTNFPQVDAGLLDLKSISGDPLPVANLLEIKTVLDYEAAASSALTPGVSTSGATSGAVDAATPSPRS